MFRKKTLEDIGVGLDREAQRNGDARDYEDLSSHISDNAYLYYIHHRIGWTNRILKEIRASLLFIGVGIWLIFAHISGWFGG